MLCTKAPNQLHRQAQRTQPPTARVPDIKIKCLNTRVYLAEFQARKIQ